MIRMHLLVLGANGLLGSNVVATALTRGWECIGTYHTNKPTYETSLYELDIRDSERFAAILDSHDFDAVLNCAAMTDVDSCEEHSEQARAVNAQASGTLARACDTRNLPFVHISTDYVFDGRSQRRYSETAQTNPLQVYGESKLAGEQAVRREHASPVIVRLSFVHGVHRSTGSLVGFPAWVRDRLQAGETTPLFTDQRVTASRAGQVAETLLDLLDATGMFHVASRSCVTPYEFGDKIRERLGASDELLIEGLQSDVDRPATRPRDTCLDVSRVETVLGREQPTLASDIDSIVTAL